MKSKSTCAVLGLIPALWMVGCDDTTFGAQEPRMVVASSGTDDALGTSWKATEDLTICPAALAHADAPLYVRHFLPDKIALELPLQVVIETACGTREAAVHHVDNIATAVLVPARGALCGTMVTATIANDSQRCFIPPTPTEDCAALRAECTVHEADAEDARR